MKLIDCGLLFNYVLSYAGLLSIRIRQLMLEELTLRRVIMSGYWILSRRFDRQLAEGFVHRASGQDACCAKDIGIAEVIRRLGNGS
ncbi:unnamed protein product [Musa textilis]